MREFLVTRLICSECNNALQLTYDGDKRPYKGEHDHITGAAKVEAVIYAMPCSTCLRPVEKLREAMRVLIDNAADGGRS